MSVRGPERIVQAIRPRNSLALVSSQVHAVKGYDGWIVEAGDATVDQGVLVWHPVWRRFRMRFGGQGFWISALGNRIDSQQFARAPGGEGNSLAIGRPMGP